MGGQGSFGFVPAGAQNLAGPVDVGGRGVRRSRAATARAKAIPLPGRGSSYPSVRPKGRGVAPRPPRGSNCKKVGPLAVKRPRLVVRIRKYTNYYL